MANKEQTEEEKIKAWEEDLEQIQEEIDNEIYVNSHHITTDEFYQAKKGK